VSATCISLCCLWLRMPVLGLACLVSVQPCTSDGDHCANQGLLCHDLDMWSSMQSRAPCVSLWLNAKTHQLC
jgi:hypothetical protein